MKSFMWKGQGKCHAAGLRGHLHVVVAMLLHIIDLRYLWHALTSDGVVACLQQ